MNCTKDIPQFIKELTQVWVDCQERYVIYCLIESNKLWFTLIAACEAWRTNSIEKATAVELIYSCFVLSKNTCLRRNTLQPYSKCVKGFLLFAHFVQAATTV